MAITLRPVYRGWSSPRARGTLVILTLMIVAIEIGRASRPSVWVENLSSRLAVFFVTDSSAGPGGWYVVPALTVAHAGSDGLGSPDVRVNVLGWRHEDGHVGPTAPGHYDDTVYDVPSWSAVRLLIEPSGQPSVSLAPEPPGLPHLAVAPLENLSEAELCKAVGL